MNSRDRGRPPTRAEAAILRELDAGDHLVFSTKDSVVLAKSGKSVRLHTANQMVKQGWITQLDLPLFALGGGRITEKGRGELRFL